VIRQGQYEVDLIAKAKTPELAICRAILAVSFDREHPTITPMVRIIPTIQNAAFKGQQLMRRKEK